MLAPSFQLSQTSDRTLFKIYPATMKLVNLGISFYRSIGEQPVLIDLTKKISVLVGANNCGKSNVLRALELICAKPNQLHTIAEIDFHQRKKINPPRYHITAITEAADDSVIRCLKNFTISWDQRGNESYYCVDIDRLEFGEFNRLREKYIGSYYTEMVDQAHRRRDYPIIANGLANGLKAQFPRYCLIPQFREIRPSDSYAINGNGIVKLLASWHHPEIGDDANFDRFERVQNLLRVLIDAPDIVLEVGHKQDEIIVRRGELRLPLASFGTGIHELVILAIAVLSQSEALVCIEEPEIHLHPLLQRRFIEFLRTQTNNRYVITTHSPALIAPGTDTDVIHLWQDKGITCSRRTEATADSLRVLRDLGLSASDLLQANSVLWVEGPSDRIYLNRWISLLAPELREGIDYSVMFYGGRLLSHLCLAREDSEEMDDLINLLRINQHSAVLIDSDRNRAGEGINSTKERVRNECEKSGVLCWISVGKEIENCLPNDAIVAAYRELTKLPLETAFVFRPYDLLEKSLAKWIGRDWRTCWSYDTAKPNMARGIVKHVTAQNMKQETLDWTKKLIAVIKHSLVTV